MRNLAAALLLLLLVSAPAWAGKGVVLNFSDVDISTMVKFISDLTGKNFILDERVKGKISVYSPAKLSTDEAFNVFTSVLELKGFTIVPAGKVYKVVPLSAARQSGTRVIADHDRGAVNDAYQARIITLTYISPQDAVSFLQPMISKDGHIAPFGPGNMLLVVDSAINIQKLLSILEVIDTPQRREGAELVYLKNAPVDGVARLVSDWLGGRNRDPKASGTSGTAGVTGGIVIPDTRLNALVVFGTDKDKEDIKRLVSLVDIAPPTSSGKINVYFLEYADATEMVKVLDGFIKGAAATAPGQPQGTVPTQQSPFEGGKISVVADKPTNSLVIAASPNDYQSLLGVIQKLDKRRRQVYVQATIAEVSLTKLEAAGVQWGMIGGGGNNGVGAIGAYDPMGALSDLASVLGTLKAAGFTIPSVSGSAVNFAGFIRALEQNNLVNILSTPNILTSDNKEAEIFVGYNVPFLGNTTTVGGTNATYQSIDRKDTGITLKITPQITEGEYVKMDVYEEISSVIPTPPTISTTKPTDLVTQKRNAKTSVVVKNNSTIVIGGLIQVNENEVDNKIPWLGDIPGLGWLFRYRSKTVDKTNLIIILTPKVIKDATDMDTLSDSRRERFNQFIQDTEVNVPAEVNKKQ